MILLINIPDKDYEFIKDAQILIGRGSNKRIEYEMINAIKNGIPQGEKTCKNCKYNNIPSNVLKPCTFCCHNRIDMFERKEEENEDT